jgi:meiotically up-regulated gene 157 (Mug157) protein
MHESYNVNNPNQFSRPWFCWADALFSEFVMSMTNEDCRGKRPNVTGLDL